MLPIGLGTQAGAYAKVFTDTFTRLVLNGESNPQTVLQQEGTQLQAAPERGGRRLLGARSAEHGSVSGRLVSRR